MKKETTNLSKIRREKMLETINEIKKNVCDEIVLNNLSLIENELTKKKYGLIWEEHEERVDKELETQIPTFEDIRKKTILNNKKEKYNFLLEGDNLHSLYLLEKTHKGKIDTIIIDPPYNTGNKDFIYDDAFIDTEDGYRHSKWLSFMNKRLEIAKKLLSDIGTIFINIDDNEVSQLKILCDNIFGEENYVNTISVKMKQSSGASGGGEDKRLKKNIEYVLIYAKDYSAMNQFKNNFSLTEISQVINDYKANDKSWKYTRILESTGNKEFYKTIYDGSGDEIKIYKHTDYKMLNINDLLKERQKDYSSNDQLIQKIYLDYFDKIFRDTNAQSSIRTRVNDSISEKNDSDFYSIEYIPKSGKNKGNLVTQYYKGKNKDLIAWFKDVGVIENNKVYKKDIRGTYWDGYNLNNLTKEGQVKFEKGKKPLKLITDIIEMTTENDSIVLDFFAGSGTTGHAVLDVNSRDNGNRQFILCTNNESNICEEITYQRLLNVSKGTPRIAPIKFNLKYYKTAYIPRINTEKENLHDNLLINIKNLIQLENGIEIDDKIIKVYLDETELDKFSLNEKELDECNKIYISSDILLTSEQEMIFEKNNIEVFVIPEYYFEDEIMEVA